MSHPVERPLRERMDVDFVEADVETAFTLVDMAESELGEGNAEPAAHAIGNAETVFADLEQRLSRLPPAAQRPFTRLVEEVRREIDLAKLHHSRANRQLP